jgi:hypothetical protein
MLLKPAPLTVTFVLAISVFGSPSAQTPAVPLQSPLDRVLPDDVGNIEVKQMQALAARLGIPFGFEEVGALAEEVRGPFYMSTRMAARIVGVRPRPIDGRGLRFRQALDAVISADRRYEWRDMDGVAVIRPVAAWQDAAHPLLRQMRPVRFDDARVADAFDAMARSVDRTWRPSARPFDDENSLSVDFAGGTLFDLLNAVVRTHDGLYWTLLSNPNVIMLDGNRAVEAVEPRLSLGTPAGTIGVRFTPATSLDQSSAR